jgi:hypothetical protein
MYLYQTAPVQSLGLHMCKLHLCLVCDLANENWLKEKSKHVRLA